MLSKSLFWLALVVLVGVAHGQSFYQPPAPIIYKFTQQIDHFNTSDTRTFTQRVLVYSNYWTANGSTSANPVIFFTPGGEANAQGGYDHNGIMFEWGVTIGAFMLFPEHRFYGDSLPFGPVDSYKFENIVYLTVEQALADYAAIINWAKTTWKMPSNTQVVSFGGSYPGELAAYMRIRYPDLITGALASSAPLLYHQGMTVSNIFFISATRTFGIESQECPTIVEKAFALMEQQWSDASARESFSKSLGLCEPASDFRLVTLWIENAFASLGMDNYPYPIGDSPAWPMRQACSNALSTYSATGNTVAALHEAINVAYNASGKKTCHLILEEYLPCADITGCGAPSPNGFSWDYQSCTQIVSDVDTGNGDMFPPHPYNFTALSDYCWQRWRAVPQPLQLLQTYDITTATNIIWSNGNVDPWAGGGVLIPFNTQQNVFVMDFAAHHLDLRGSSASDPQNVVSTREQEWVVIQKWLGLLA